MNHLTQNARELRKSMTKEERRLWYDFLRDYPLRFMRQRPIDRYIVDFYCASAGLAVELDGGQHYEPDAARDDAERDRTLAALGIAVLRIPNSEIWKNFAGVCERIDLEARARSAALSQKGALPRRMP